MEDIYKKVEEVEEYLRKAKIPNLPTELRNKIETMITDKKTYQEVIAYAGSRGESINSSQIKKHKDTMPLIARLKPEATSYLSPQEESTVNVPEKDYKTLSYVKTALRNELLPGTVDILRERIVNEGHTIPFKEVMEAFDKFLKADQLLNGAPTEIVESHTTVTTEGQGNVVDPKEKDTLEQVNALLMAKANEQNN